MKEQKPETKKFIINDGEATPVWHGIITMKELKPETKQPILENQAILEKSFADIRRRESERQKIEEQGVAALKRLFSTAQNPAGQSKVIANFLLGCYNGSRFTFDLTDFRALDWNLFDDCIAVLKMDNQPRQEVHCYFDNGGKRFEQTALDYGITDQYQQRKFKLELLAEAIELLRNAEYADGVATVKTQDCEALQATIAKVEEKGISHD